MTPKFIAIEGPDGSGKSTLATRLTDYISTSIMGCTKLVAPGSNKFGKQVREWAKTGQFKGAKYSELMAFLFAHTALIELDITPTLRSGKSVVIDRYTLSTIVYQGLTGTLNYSEMKRGLDNLQITLEPDVYIVLNAPYAVLLDRITSRGAVDPEDPYEKRIQALQSAYSIVDKLIDTPVYYIDTSGKTEDEVFNEARNKVIDKIFSED